MYKKIYNFFQSEIKVYGKEKTLSKIDLKKIFNINNKKTINQLYNFSKKLKFFELTKKQINQEFNKVKDLTSQINDKSSFKRLPIWNKGWDDNLQKILNFSKKIDIKSSLTKKTIPNYYLRKKQRVFKLKNNKFIYPKTKNFELKFHRLILHFINIKFLDKIDCLYEFGAGSCQNLIFFLNLKKKLRVFGSDWSASTIKILKLIKKNYQDRVISFQQINMFKKFSLKVHENSCLFTFCSMEQLGKNFKNFINSSLKSNFKIYVHVEPINELSRKDRFGKLSVNYLKRRNYLFGFLKFLKNLENKKIIKILYKQQVFSNSFFDCWSIIVWKKL